MKNQGLSAKAPRPFFLTGSRKSWLWQKSGTVEKCAGRIRKGLTHGVPEHGLPDDDAALPGAHIVVGYASPATGRELPWECADGEDVRFIDLQSRAIVNNAESYIACCRAGLGLFQVPRVDVQHLLAAGELVEVLPECRALPMKISIVYPHRRQRSARLMAFFEWFETLVQPHLA